MAQRRGLMSSLRIQTNILFAGEAAQAAMAPAD
jgi:hypothetical protein